MKEPRTKQRAVVSDDQSNVESKAAADPQPSVKATTPDRLRSDEWREGDPLRDNGPTLEEFVAAGYKAEIYPPRGYKPRLSESDREKAWKEGLAKAKANRPTLLDAFGFNRK